MRSELVETFLQHCRCERNLSIHTIRAYRGDVEDFARFLGSDVSLDAVDASTVRRYLDSLFGSRRLKATTVRRRTASLKAFYGWAVHHGILASSPLDGLRLAIRIPKRLPSNVQRGELRELLRWVARAIGLDPASDYEGQLRDRALEPREFRLLTLLVAVEIFLATGLRVGELTSLTLDCIDLQDGAVRVHGKEPARGESSSSTRPSDRSCARMRPCAGTRRSPFHRFSLTHEAAPPHPPSSAGTWPTPPAGQGCGE